MTISFKEFLDAICFNGRKNLQNRSDYEEDAFPQMELTSIIRYGHGVIQMLEKFLAFYDLKFDTFMQDDIEHQVMWRLIYDIQNKMLQAYFPAFDATWDDKLFQMDQMEKKNNYQSLMYNISMINLLKETEEELKFHGKTWKDVEFICNSDYEISIENFKIIAAKSDYDEGFGHVYIPLDLMIVGKDWWLERYEYDGQECWVYKTKPNRPEETRSLNGFSDRNYEETCIFEND